MTSEGSGLQAFEGAALRLAEERHRLVLFVNGASPLSAAAVKNLRALCDEYLSDRYELTVVDVHQHPDLAIDQSVIAVPTLVRERPAPVRLLVGDMSDPDRVLRGLGLHGGDSARRLTVPTVQ